MGKTIGMEIEWYTGKCLTQTMLRKKPKRGSGNTKPIISFESCESFFHYLKTHKNDSKYYEGNMYDDDDDGGGSSSGHESDDDDDANETEADIWKIEWREDYKIGCKILDEIIPRAIRWFDDVHSDYDDNDDDEEDHVDVYDDYFFDNSLPARGPTPGGGRRRRKRQTAGYIDQIGDIAAGVKDIAAAIRETSEIVNLTNLRATVMGIESFDTDVLMRALEYFHHNPKDAQLFGVR
ncbi:uncharacterized protein LOC143892411 isoform X2 [Tasmannia lanceolata]|uniref:uncharacterized protein LOC143892411 isoform X2 n=1 Tax=Tasmannia lanceolata TaxID=3420 RepID=UPI0040647AD0